MKRKNLVYTVYAALFAALIFVGTYAFKIPTPVGYIHLGDGFIFIAAALLPTPFALGAALVGAGLSDLVAGFPLWVAPTVIIKCACALCFTSKKIKIFCARNIIALAASAAITVGGYYFFGALIYSSFVTPLYEIAFNLIQSVAGIIIFSVFGIFFDKTPALRKVIGKARDKTE